MDCTFCKIGSGLIPTDAIFASPWIMAFKSREPVAAVHVIVIVTEHFDSMDDPKVSHQYLGLLLTACRAVAHRLNLDKTGYRVVINTGDDAGQTMKHLHAHVIGGQKLGDIA